MAADPGKVGRSSIVGDIGTHAYHLVHEITGLDVDEVRADMFVCGGPKPQPDTAHINMRLSNGAPAVMLLSNAVAGQYCGLRIRIWGETGSLEWDQEEPELLRFLPFDAPEQIMTLQAGEVALPGPADGLRGMLFIDACADSHEAGGTWMPMGSADAAV